MSDFNIQTAEQQFSNSLSSRARILQDSSQMRSQSKNAYPDDEDLYMDERDRFEKSLKLEAGPLIDKSCLTCGGFGVIVKRGAGTIDTTKCSCVGDSWGSEKRWEEYQKIEKTIEHLNRSQIPPRFANSKFKGGKTFEDVAPKKLIEWFDYICSSPFNENGNCFIFLCGNIGNGKTHLSAECVRRFILRTARSAKFLHADELIESKKDSTVFADRQNPGYKKDLESKRKVVRYTDLVVIDEIGQKKISDFGQEAFEEFVDLRYQSGLPTIFISNHTFRKESSLNGRTIDEIVGSRVSDRLQEAVVIEFTEESKRGLADGPASSLAKREYEDFMLPAVKKGQSSALHVMVRGSIFRVVSNQDRGRLTKKGERGEIIELSRSEPEVLYDIWHKGSRLEIGGAICDFEDHDVYLALAEILHDNHRDRYAKGIYLATSAREVLLKLGKDPRSGANERALRRSLKRLSTITINYSDDIGNVWGGGIISSYFYEGSTQAQGIIVKFNPDMAPAYDNGRFFKYRLSDSRKLSQFAKGVLAFLTAMKNEKKPIGIEKWQKILGQQTMELKKFKYNFKKAIKELMATNFLSESSLIDENAQVICHLTPDYRSSFLAAPEA